MKRESAVLLSLSLAFCSPAAMALSVFDVIELTRNGYDESEVERLIEVTNARFMIDMDGLLALGEANVPDEVISLMLERAAVPLEEPSEADQLITLLEAGFSEETIMQFVRHRNVCEPLADEDAHRLGQAGFSNAFLREFGDQVEDCREERESIALVEPVAEEVYEEAPARVTRVYRTDDTVYPASYPVRYPTTTYYPPRYYGIYDSYYYHNRITRVYPIVVYRDYSGHKHRQRYAGQRHGKHGKAGHRGRDHDRRRNDGDGRRADRRGDRREGDRDRRRKRDSEGRPRRSHSRTDPNPQLLVGTTPRDTASPPVSPPDRVRRNTGRRLEVPASTKPFVRSKRSSEHTVRPRSPGLPRDVSRRVERPVAQPTAPSRALPTVRPPVGQRPSAPRFRPPQRAPSVAPPPRTRSVTPPPRTAPVAQPPRSLRVTTPPRAPRVKTPPRTAPVATPPPVMNKPRLPHHIPETVRKRIEKVQTHDK